MTNDQRERNLGHIASLMCGVRDEWDIGGCVAALRKQPDLPVPALTIAAMRYATDPANLTPAHLADLTNRAWDSDWHQPCPVHPEQARRSTSGECASCRAERLAATEPPAVRAPSPMPPELRARMLEAIQPKPEPAKTPAVDPGRMAEARAQLDEKRQEASADA